MEAQIIKKLIQIVGQKHLTTAREDLICYSYDATALEYLPEAVIFPGTRDEIAGIMKLATAEGFPVVPRGAGSGFVGGALPVKGGLVLSLKRLDRILEIDKDNMTALVEPGVVTGHLQKEVEALGLFYPPDPSSLKFCTLGGNVAMGSGGPRAVKYGVTRDYVMKLEVVLPTGEVITTGTAAAKGVVGYDLARLMVGSEGTLGIVTKILLKLIPKPIAKVTLLAEFPSALEAGRTVSAVMASGVIPSVLEFIDNSTLKCVKAELKDPPSEQVKAILLIEADGSEAAIAEDSLVIEKLCRENGAVRIKKSRDKKESEQLWQTRRAISPSLYKLATKKINEDIAVPRDKVPELIGRLEKIAHKHNVIMANFGHAGDGNIHVNIMVNKGNVEEEKRGAEAVKEVFQTALDLGGTISGEHGVGISKQPFIEMEISHREIELMEGIKKVFDPANILNPGKIFPSKVLKNE